jgi:hypothetical protein
LCGVYARREANYGNIDLARKVFDMALLSVEGIPEVYIIYSVLCCDLFEFESPLSYFFEVFFHIATNFICCGEEFNNMEVKLTNLSRDWTAIQLNFSLFWVIIFLEDPIFTFKSLIVSSPCEIYLFLIKNASVIPLNLRHRMLICT